MTQFWIYTTVFLLGALGGVLLGVVVDQGPVFKSWVGKIKQKHSPGGVIDVVMDALPTVTKTKREIRKERRKKRRAERRARPKE